jgi:multiple RNA-binding domain-containing protein 1
MSRLIITSLPPSVTSSSLKSHFQQSAGPGGTITDVKIPHTPHGQGRGFAFVGYRTEEEAEKAKEWFHNTWLEGRRVKVALVDVNVFFFCFVSCLCTVQGTKDAPPPRPNKRRKLDPSPRDTKPSKSLPSDVKTKSKLKKSQRDTEEKADGQLDEFMQVMKPRTKKGPSWANEGRVLVSEPVPTTKVDGKEDGEEEKRKDEGISDLDWMKMHLKGDLEAKVFEQDEGVRFCWHQPSFFALQILHYAARTSESSHRRKR